MSDFMPVSTSTGRCHLPPSRVEKPLQIIRSETIKVGVAIVADEL
jgi:hypothetical protein